MYEANADEVVATKGAQDRNSRYAPTEVFEMSEYVKLPGYAGATIVRVVLMLPYASRASKYTTSLLGEPVKTHDVVEVETGLTASVLHAQELPCVSVVDGNAMSLHRRYCRVLLSVAVSATVPEVVPPIEESRVAAVITGTVVSRVNVADMP